MIGEYTSLTMLSLNMRSKWAYLGTSRNVGSCGRFALNFCMFFLSANQSFSPLTKKIGSEGGIKERS